jgi:hypothetical protein
MKFLIILFLLLGCGSRKTEIEKIAEIEKKDLHLNIRVIENQITSSGRITRTFIYEPIDNTKPAYIDGKKLINGKLTDVSTDEKSSLEIKKDSTAAIKDKGAIKKKKKAKKIEAKEASKIWIFWLGVLVLIYFLITYYFKPKNLLK